MSLAAIVANPLTDPVPDGWDEFVAAQRLPPVWHSSLLRAVDWCTQAASSMVLVHEASSAEPVAIFHARYVGPTRMNRFGALVSADRRDPSSHVTECRQCGGWESVHVLRLSRRRARYWCEECGATVTLARPDPLRPVQLLVATRVAKESRSATADGSAAELREVLPAPMLTWLGRRDASPVTMSSLGKRAIYRLYAEWDAKLGESTPDERAALAVDGGAPPVAGLPAFSKLAQVYQVDRMIAALEAYLAAGARPLREEVLARLSAPFAPVRPCRR